MKLYNFKDISCGIEYVVIIFLWILLLTLAHTHILVDYLFHVVIAAPFSDSTTEHTTDPATLLLTTTQESTTDLKSEASPTNTVSKAASTTIRDRITPETTSASVHNGTTPVVTIELVFTSQRSVFIGIGVLVSIIILMGMIIVIGVIIVIIYIKKKHRRAIDNGQGLSHQLETALTKGMCENNCFTFVGQSKIISKNLV